MSHPAGQVLLIHFEIALGMLQDPPHIHGSPRAFDYDYSYFLVCSILTKQRSYFHGFALFLNPLQIWLEPMKPISRQVRSKSFFFLTPKNSVHLKCFVFVLDCSNLRHDELLPVTILDSHEGCSRSKWTWSSQCRLISGELGRGSVLSRWFQVTCLAFGSNMQKQVCSFSLSYEMTLRFFL